MSWCAGWMQGWTFQGGWWKCCFSRGPLTPLHPNIFEYISCVGVSCVLLGCIACCVLGASMMAGRLAGRQAGRLAGGGIWGGHPKNLPDEANPRTCQTKDSEEKQGGARTHLLVSEIVRPAGSGPQTQRPGLATCGHTIWDFNGFVILEQADKQCCFTFYSFLPHLFCLYSRTSSTV